MADVPKAEQLVICECDSEYHIVFSKTNLKLFFHLKKWGQRFKRQSDEIDVYIGGFLFNSSEGKVVFRPNVISILATVNTMTVTSGHLTDVSKVFFALLSSSYISFMQPYDSIWE